MHQHSLPPSQCFRPIPPPSCPNCRPEVKFNGLQELLGRINTDIGIATTQLELPQWQAYKEQLAAEAPKL